MLIRKKPDILYSAVTPKSGVPRAEGDFCRYGCRSRPAGPVCVCRETGNTEEFFQHVGTSDPA